MRLQKGEKANKKKMATVATVGTRQARVRTAETVVDSLFDGVRSEDSSEAKPERKRVWASMVRPIEDVFRELVAEAAKRDPLGLKLRVAIMNGQRSLWRLATMLLPGFIQVLDLLHVMEYLWKAAHAFHAERSLEAEAWVRSHALMILRGQVSQVIKGMRWQLPGGEAMLKLRAIHLSDDMDEYWPFQKQQEQRRLHGHLAWRSVS